MIYYTLTCIKDMPGVEKGFSRTFSEFGLNYPCGICFSNDSEEDEKMHILKQYRNNSEFVKVEPDLSEAVEELTCPKCGKVSLFTFADDEDKRYYDDGVEKWYKGTGLVCGCCGWKVYLSSVCTKTKVHW